MSTPLSPEGEQLIDRPNFAHLATLIGDGSPQSVSVWVGREGDRIVVCTGETRLKPRTRAAIPAWHCRSWVSPILTRKFRFAAAWSSDALILTCKP